MIFYVRVTYCGNFSVGIIFSGKLGYRFGGGLNKRRPNPEMPTEDIKENEVRYVSQLYEAYSDHLGKTIDNIKELQRQPRLFQHFNRQREDFYKAESLRRFARDELPVDEPFETLQNEIYRGVIDVAEDDHPDGFVCVKETVKEAKRLAITSNVLIKYIDGSDRSGVCPPTGEQGHAKMGEKMNGSLVSRETYLFNTPLEIGLSLKYS
jgi:hypothetical protein